MNIEEIHSKLLDILTAVAKLCDENNIRYYMIGGTMLGAVRHKGFIPWDDDIDIAMPRSDYERFLEIDPRHLPSEYTLKTYKNSDIIIGCSSKVEDNRTSLSYKWTDHIKENIGLNIDVFPIDGVPQQKHKQELHYWYLLGLRKLSSLLFVNTISRPFFQRYGARLIQKIFPLKKIFLLNLINKRLKKYNFDDCDYVANYCGVWGKKEIMLKEYFGIPTKYPFENQQFNGVNNFDAYLTTLYGNYMTLPPENKRKSHHDYTVNMR